MIGCVGANVVARRDKPLVERGHLELRSDGLGTGDQSVSAAHDLSLVSRLQMASAAEPDNRKSSPQAASVIVLRHDSVLMVERARPPFQGLWSFPGGRSESGETVEATARRELFEETGLTLRRLLLLGALLPAPEVSAVELSVFAARAGPGEPQAGDDALRAAFVPFQLVLARRVTAGGPKWIARAILALAGMDKLHG